MKVDKKHVLKGHAEVVTALCFSPDSSVLASGSEDKTIRLWDPSTGSLRNGGLFAGHAGRIHGLAFIGSGTILFSASKDKTVMEWDMIRFEHRKTLSGESRSRMVKAGMLPNVTYLVSSSAS